MTWLFFLTGCSQEYKHVDAYPFRQTNFALRYLAVCGLLAVGEALGFAASPASACWPIALGVLLLVVLAGYGWSSPRWPYLAVCLLGFVLALFSESCRARVFNQCDYSSSPLTAEFPVEGNAKATKKFLSFDTSLAGVDVRVMIRRQSSKTETNLTPCRESLVTPAVGDVWRCAGWLERKPRGERRRRTLWVCGRGSFAERVSTEAEGSLRAVLRRLRKSLSYNIGYGLSHDSFAADLDRAIVLGERANMSPETRQMFADAGTVHVFAISGLHVGVIASMLVFLLMAMFFPLRWVAVLLAPILCGYVMMIDAPPSAVRAATMSIVYYSAPMFLRKSDSLVAWSITFLIFHILNPAMLMKVGSLLSFAVMLGVILYVRWAEAFKSGKLDSAMGVSLAAWASGVAIAARVFERITIGGLFANLVMIPLASLSVIFGFLGSIAGFVCPWLSKHFNNLGALLIEAMTGISWMATKVPYANLVVAPWPIWMCVAWYVAVVMTFWLMRSVYLRRRQLI